MKINEIFYSIQGEGKWMGKPNIFIRVTGCNLRCKYCDTKYAYENGYDMNINDIVAKVNIRHDKTIQWSFSFIDLLIDDTLSKFRKPALSQSSVNTPPQQ